MVSYVNDKANIAYALEAPDEGRLSIVDPISGTGTRSAQHDE